MQKNILPKRDFARSRVCGSRGFNLIELLIGMAIMSIMGMIAIPQLLAVTEEYRLNAIAREVVGNLSNTRVLAITQNSDHRVRVSAAGTYVVEEDVTGTWTERASFDMPDGFSLSAVGAIVQFRRWGNASPVATFSVTNDNGTVAQVVTTASGRSNVQ